MQCLEQMFTFRKPRASDGASVWQLVKETGVLDLNSAYSYIMLCDLFRDTCVIAEANDTVVGFVSAFRKQDDPKTLFIWQIAVSANFRGQGLGIQLLNQLYAQVQNSADLQLKLPKIHFAELTISPSNQASRALFQRWAAKLEAPINEFAGYPAESFPVKSHEDEIGYRIGPFNN